MESEVFEGGSLGPPAKPHGGPLKKRRVKLTARQAKSLPARTDEASAAATARMFPNGNPSKVAKEIVHAVEEMSTHSPGSLGRFEKLFKLRGSLPGLVESLPMPESLIKVLSGLLKIGYGSTDSIPAFEESTSLPSDAFVQNLISALVSLATIHPTALLFFERDRDEAGYTTLNAIERLLTRYLERGQSLTY